MNQTFLIFILFLKTSQLRLDCNKLQITTQTNP